MLHCEIYITKVAINKRKKINAVGLLQLIAILLETMILNNMNIPLLMLCILYNL